MFCCLYFIPAFM